MPTLAPNQIIRPTAKKAQPSKRELIADMFLIHVPIRLSVGAAASLPVLWFLNWHLHRGYTTECISWQQYTGHDDCQASAEQAVQHTSQIMFGLLMLAAVLTILHVWRKLDYTVKFVDLGMQKSVNRCIDLTWYTIAAIIGIVLVSAVLPAVVRATVQIQSGF